MKRSGRRPSLRRQKPTSKSSPRATLRQTVSTALTKLERPLKWRDVRLYVVVGGSLLTACVIWAYWPTLVEMVDTWEREPDYSHGYIIPLISLYFLWARRKDFPGWTSTAVWPGLALIGASLVLRYAGALWFLGSVDGWSFVMCVAGAAWVLLGTRVFWWAMPAIAFLSFMVPLPYRIENGLSVTLQGIATNLSCWTLQLLGQPALAEGNTIWLGDMHLEVERACSGLRIFLGIIAIAFAYVIMVRRPWWEKGLLLVAVIPVALVANAARIVATALLYQLVSGEVARRFSHDFAGWVTIPLAALMFGLLLLYLKLAFREIEVIDPNRMLKAKGRTS